MVPSPPSANISTIEYKLEFDISGGTPQIKLTNESTGPNLAPCKWWVVITTPSGTPVHTGSLATPDMTGAWTTWTMPELWPQPFGEIEWSGYPYNVTLYVNDGTNTYNLAKTAEICRPNGNTAAAKNNFGTAAFTTKIQCTVAKVFAQDATKYLYKTSNGTVVSQTWTMIYPPDNNGFRLPNAVVTGLPYAYFDVTYNGYDYYIFLSTVVSYDLGDNVFVIVAYKTSHKFNVLCNMDLCDLVCSYNELISRVQNGQCSNSSTADFKNQLLLINSKVNVVLMSQTQGCDIDVPGLIDEIKKLGNFDCGCSGSSAGAGGIIPQPTPSSTTVGCCPLTLPVYVQGTTSAPPPCPGSFFPAAVYAPDGATLIGIALDADNMISIINANAAWKALGTAINMGNCQVGFIKNPNVVSVPPVYVQPGTVINVVDQSTGLPPAACPGSFFPATVYAPDGTTPLGVAANAIQMVTLINASPAWNAYGTAYYNSTNCTVAFIPAAGVDPSTIPPIVITGTSGCAGGIQNYNVTVQDICGITDPPITTSSFPLNAWVDFGAGLVSLGSVANNAAFIAALNGATGKPPSVTFSAGSSPWILNYTVNNTDCAGYSGVITIYTDANSAAFMLFAGNHKTVAGPMPNSGGVYGVGLKTGTIIGRTPLPPNDEMVWHVTKVQGNYLFAAQGDEGRVYCWNITNPLMPLSLGYVQLPDTGSGTCFNPGVPNEWGVGQVFDLYFPTDFHTMGIREVYVVESRTGSIWHVDFVGVPSVPKYYQDQRLIGMCPRIHTKGELWFTQDGNMEAVTGPGVGDGVVIRMAVSGAWNAGTISEVTIIPNFTEEVWAASFDSANWLIYFSGQKGTIVTYDVSVSSIVNSYPTVMGQTANRRLNTKFWLNKLYHSTFAPYTAPGGLSTATRFIDTTTLGGLNTIVNFQPFTPPAALSSNTTHWNFLPLSGCTGILTFENGSSAAGFAVFKLDGTFVSLIMFAAGAAYNVVPVAGVAVYSPTSLV